MACRGDVDTEDLERIVSIARSGENILCGIDGCIDIFMESYEEAIQFGRRYKEVYIKR